MNNISKIVFFILTSILLTSCKNESKTTFTSIELVNKYIDLNKTVTDTLTNVDSVVFIQTVLHNNKTYNLIKKVAPFPCMGVGCSSIPYELLIIESMDTTLKKFSVRNDFVGSNLGIIDNEVYLLLFENPDKSEMKINLNDFFIPSIQNLEIKKKKAFNDLYQITSKDDSFLYLGKVR